MVEGHTTHPAYAPVYLSGGYSMPARVRAWWVAVVVTGVTCGDIPIVVAVNAPPDTPLVGRIATQPLWKMLMALLLARAASLHEILHGQHWLIGAMMFSAPGDLWPILPGLAFPPMVGLGYFLLVHLRYLRVLVGLRDVSSAIRVIGAGVMIDVAIGVLLRYWSGLGELKGPVTAYTVALLAMMRVASLACLPGPLTVWGAFTFTASDVVIGIGVFVFPFTDHEPTIWWSYAAAQLLISAGLLTRRISPPHRAAI